MQKKRIKIIYPERHNPRSATQAFKGQTPTTPDGFNYFSGEFSPRRGGGHMGRLAKDEKAWTDIWRQATGDNPVYALPKDAVAWLEIRAHDDLQVTMRLAEVRSDGEKTHMTWHVTNAPLDPDERVILSWAIVVLPKSSLSAEYTHEKVKSPLQKLEEERQEAFRANVRETLAQAQKKAPRFFPKKK